MMIMMITRTVIVIKDDNIEIRIIATSDLFLTASGKWYSGGK